jgi:hypothetical protein
LNWPSNTEFPSTFGCKQKISAPSETSNTDPSWRMSKPALVATRIL